MYDVTIVGCGVVGASLAYTLSQYRLRVLERLKPQIRQPIIASGLLADKQDVVAALSAGAQAVSTTKPELWEI